MELIGQDQTLINCFQGENSLLDSVIEKMEIFSVESSVNINIWLVMRSSSQFDRVLLQFGGCKQYGFFHTDDYNFYNVELVKFFQTTDGMFYASFDPVNELEEVCDEDQDFIVARSISAYRV